MLEKFKNSTEEELMKYLDESSSTQLQNLIDECKSSYDNLKNTKAQIEAQQKICNDNLENEMKSLKDLGIDSVTQLEEKIKSLKEELNKELASLIHSLNEVN